MREEKKRTKETKTQLFRNKERKQNESKTKVLQVLNLLRGTYQSLSLLQLQYYCHKGCCVLEKEKEYKRGGREKRRGREERKIRRGREGKKEEKREREKRKEERKKE